MWSHHKKKLSKFLTGRALDRAECQSSDVIHIVINTSWSHFIVLPEWNIMLIAKLCSLAAFGEANSNVLRLNVHVVTQGDGMTQLCFFAYYLFCHHYFQSNLARLWTCDYSLESYNTVKEPGLMMPNTKNSNEAPGIQTEIFCSEEVSANRSVYTHKVCLCLRICVQTHNLQTLKQNPFNR